MSDALGMLRTFVKSKKDFHEDEDKIIFGDVFYYKNIKTTYLIYGTGKDGRPKDYYTLECLAFLIKNRDLQHSMYVKNAGTRNISVVLRPDRRELLSFLDGEVETTASIDKYAPIEIAMQRPQAYTKSSGQKRTALQNDEEIDLDLSASKQAKMDYQIDQSNAMDLGKQASSQSMQAPASQTTKELFIGRLAKKFEDQQASRPITDNIMPLSEQLSIEKIVAIKSKKKAQQRTKVSTGVEIDDDLLGPATTGATQPSTQKKIEESKSKYNFDYTTSAPGFMSGIGTMGTDDSDTIMREIMQRERTVRTRFTVQQSTGKQFDKDISAYLQSIKAKEEGADLNSSMNNSLNTSNTLNTSQQNSQKRALGYNRFDQERYQTKDDTGGFVIDTKLTYQPNGGNMSMTPNPNSPGPNNKGSQLNKSSSYFQSSQITQQKTTTALGGNANQNTNSSVNKPKSGAGLQKRSHQNPIIIIPAARTSLIQMVNVMDILQELKFITVDEKKKKLNNQNLYKDSELIMHRREDGQTVQFKVIDNVNKLQPNDWDRVVAVFAFGAQWQFKDWQLGEGNPAVIFRKIKGFHLKLSGQPLDANIAKWPVTTIELDSRKRHLDRARLLAFWDELDKYMTKIKHHFYG